MTDFLIDAEYRAFFGYLSALASTMAFAPYIIDTLKRRTQPQRCSWFIWSVLGTIAFFSQNFEGATTSLWFAGAQVSGTIVISLLSIRFGVGGILNKADLAVLALAGLGLYAWYVTETAVYALAITISISLLGGSITIMKAFHRPNGETLTTWCLSLVGAVFALLAVGHLNWVLLAYPLYLLTLNSAIVLALALGRRRQRFDILSA